MKFDISTASGNIEQYEGILDQFNFRYIVPMEEKKYGEITINSLADLQDLSLKIGSLKFERAMEHFHRKGKISNMFAFNGLIINFEKGDDQSITIYDDYYE